MEKINNNFTTIFTYSTELNADSVEWCPHEPHQNVFVCANYELVEPNKETLAKRLGQILLFTVSNGEGLKLHQILKTSGVLDQKWCHNKIIDHSVLGVANAIGQIAVYKLNPEKLGLELLSVCAVTGEDTLILSLDWSTGILESSTPDIICSDSKGSVHLIQFSESNLELVDSWNGHTNSWGGLQFEVWIAGFYYWDTNVFFSGGDDGVFQMYDKRIEKKPVKKNNSHQAGVTSLHSNALKENTLASGSYDQHIRIWDIRNIKEETNKIKMPGEVWRLKWEPFKRNLLLAACMYNGVHVVNFSSSLEGNIVGSYYDHKNISYGVDWSYSNPNKSRTNEGSFLIGSCSFYDKLLCISKFYYENNSDM